MRILQINSVCNGSTGKIACDLAGNLIKQGHECLIAYGRGKEPKNLPSYKIGSFISVSFHGLLARFFDKSGFGSYFATKRLIKKIKEYNPDVIHLHNIHGYYINIKILFEFLKNSNKKVVWTLHDCWSFTGHCCYFDHSNCQKWKTNECRHCQHKKSYPLSFFSNAHKNYLRKEKLFSLLASNQLIIATPSQWLKNLVEKSYLKKYKISVVNNGIDTATFTYTSSLLREKYAINNKKIVLCVASIWDERKGLKKVIEICKLLPANYQVVVIGLNKKQIKRMPANIIAISRTDNLLELVQWYSTADVFFNPTLEDNYPTVLLEAISCNLSILTSAVGGCLEIASMSTQYDVLCSQKDPIKQIEFLSQSKNKLLPSYDISVESFLKKYMDLYSTLFYEEKK